MSNSDLPNQVQKFFKPLKNKKFLLALSGGVDSTVLFHLMYGLKIPFEVAHINYKLRNEDSEKDQFFMEELCSNYNIQCNIYQLNESEKKALQESNLQEKARKIRYKYFEKILSEKKLNYILLAHHADDQIEDFFLKLARNSGMRGLAGMSQISENRLRPLLNFSKDDILNYALENDIAFRVDASNESSKYSRNKIRNIILPFLAENKCEVKNQIHLLQKHFLRKTLEIESEIKPIVEDFLRDKILKISTYIELDIHRKIELARQLGEKSSFVVALDKLAKSQTKGTFIFFKDERKLFLGKDCFMLESLVNIPKLNIEFLERPANFYNDDIICVDADKIEGELHIRPYKTGDKMTPLGMQNKKLVSKILKDKKIPSANRKSHFVVEDSNKIIWLSKICISEKVKISDKTNRFCQIKLIENDEN